MPDTPRARFTVDTPDGPVVFVDLGDWYAAHGEALLHRRRWSAEVDGLAVDFLAFPDADVGDLVRQARRELAGA